LSHRNYNFNVGRRPTKTLTILLNSLRTILIGTGYYFLICFFEKSLIIVEIIRDDLYIATQITVNAMSGMNMSNVKMAFFLNTSFLFLKRFIVDTVEKFDFM